jgi:hypothetical protein
MATKKTDKNEVTPREKADVSDELTTIIRRKKIQNKVLKEMIEHLQQPSEEGKKRK